MFDCPQASLLHCSQLEEQLLQLQDAIAESRLLLETEEAEKGIVLQQLKFMEDKLQLLQLQGLDIDVSSHLDASLQVW